MFSPTSRSNADSLNCPKSIAFLNERLCQKYACSIQETLPLWGLQSKGTLRVAMGFWGTLHIRSWFATLVLFAPHVSHCPTYHSRFVRLSCNPARTFTFPKDLNMSTSCWHVPGLSQNFRCHTYAPGKHGSSRKKKTRRTVDGTTCPKKWAKLQHGLELDSRPIYFHPTFDSHWFSKIHLLVGSVGTMDGPPQISLMLAKQP